jgi:hypothetical protein
VKRLEVHPTRLDQSYTTRYVQPVIFSGQALTSIVARGLSGDIRERKMPIINPNALTFQATKEYSPRVHERRRYIKKKIGKVARLKRTIIRSGIGKGAKAKKPSIDHQQITSMP